MKCFDKILILPVGSLAPGGGAGGLDKYWRYFFLLTFSHWENKIDQELLWFTFNLEILKFNIFFPAHML